MAEFREPKLDEGIINEEETANPVEKDANNSLSPSVIVEEMRNRLIDGGFGDAGVVCVEDKLDKAKENGKLGSVIEYCQNELEKPYSPSSSIAFKEIIARANQLKTINSFADRRAELVLRSGGLSPENIVLESNPGLVSKRSVREKEAILPKKQIPPLNIAGKIETHTELKSNPELAKVRAEQLRTNLKTQEISSRWRFIETNNSPLGEDQSKPKNPLIYKIFSVLSFFGRGRENKK